MTRVTSLEGPVDLEAGQLVLRIPLDVGGDDLVAAASGIGHVDGADLVVVIPDWLAAKLGIGEGSLVVVDNRVGKFNITPSDDQLSH